MSTEQQVSQRNPSIHPGTTVGLVALRVSNLERSRLFYESLLGFQPLEQKASSVVLGGEDREPLLELIEVSGATPQPPRATGLYHVAILFPTRPDLGRALGRLIEAGWQVGQGDHLVSEALYLSDPDGNGLEIYRDRPRDTWRWVNGMVEVATGPVDIESLFEEGRRDAKSWSVLPAGVRVGHIHLKVGDIEQARQFYHSVLGFDITGHYPGVLFVSAGGYHHHIALNTWHSQGGKPTPASSAGLQRYMLAIPTREGLLEVKERLLAHQVPITEGEDSIEVKDPWNHQIHLVVPSTHAI
jgi:catechol 2,3-dioxygenase